MDDTSTSSLSEGALTERIRSAGLRATRPRLTVLSLLSELGGHHGTDEVLRVLGERRSTLSRASVFNVLNDLVAHGLVMVADAGPGRTIYEAAGERHHHFVCRKCGCIFDVPCTVGEKPCLDSGVQGLKIDEAQVIFRGPCPFESGQTLPPDYIAPPNCPNG